VTCGARRGATIDSYPCESSIIQIRRVHGEVSQRRDWGV